MRSVSLIFNKPLNSTGGVQAVSRIMLNSLNSIYDINFREIDNKSWEKSDIRICLGGFVKSFRKVRKNANILVIHNDPLGPFRNYFYSEYIGIRLARLFPKVFVVISNNIVRKVYRVYLNLLALRFQGIVVVLDEMYLEEFWFKSKIRSIPNYVTTTRDEKKRQDLVGRKQLCWAGRSSSSQKRIDLLFDLAIEMPYADFTVFTNTTLDLERVKVPANVVVRYNESFIDLISGYDGLVLTSSFEGWPTVVVEARLAGLPVFMFDSFAASESMVKTYGEIYVVPFSDISAMKMSVNNRILNREISVEKWNKSVTSRWIKLFDEIR